MIREEVLYPNTIKILANYYVSQFTVETYCFADGRCLFRQPQSVIYHWNQYDEEISKKCISVVLSTIMRR